MNSVDKLDCQIALAQMNANHDVESNLQQLETLLSNHGQVFDLLFLPENFAHMPRHEQERLDSAESFGSGKIQDFLSKIATQYGCWIVAGSVPICNEDQRKIYQSSLVFDDQGILQKRYDKIHLFDVKLANGEQYQESRFIEFGDVQQDPTVMTPWGLIGLSICYDVRFPEHYRAMSDDIIMLSVPAAFTYNTGQAHWQTLLQSRAIENQVFVVAAAQTGQHSNGRRTWGHSSLIDPWGKVIIQEKTQVSLISAKINLNQINEIRERFPSLQHKRRNDF